MNVTPERRRLADARANGTAWRKWGPYLSDRQWGTVREDYSADGNAWESFPHDHARSRTYRWGEDGIAGICDDRQYLCFALALWNSNDTILKERLFGLSGPEGNHGEDVKEYYFYLDNTPTHSYQKFLYKYPQQEFPYCDLVETNAKRGYTDHEYELIDTGIFDDDRYFDVVVEYAKASPEDLLIEIRVTNRAATPAPIRVLPTIWFRNTWTGNRGTPRPRLRRTESVGDTRCIEATHAELGQYKLYCESDPELLFTENETNRERLFQQPNEEACVKDAFHDYVIHGCDTAVNLNGEGTKAAANYSIVVDPGATTVIRLRLMRVDQDQRNCFDAAFGEMMDRRRMEADDFYRELLPDSTTQEEKRVMRQALAGMLWSKQYYEYDVGQWISEHGGRNHVVRNQDWTHLVNHDVISMPDKWEYPWYAVWDLAFHCLPLAYVDLDFAKQQLSLFLQSRYQHPSGQIPAYEWNFGDVNPPVHAYAVLGVYRIEKERDGGQGDLEFLQTAYGQLCKDFRWWEQYKDRSGKKLFEGGFLGLDNIGVFDRSADLPTGGHLEQSDGTAWMVFYAQNMLGIALELARCDEAYDDHVVSWLDRCLSIAAAMDRIEDVQGGMWDPDDGFFYDVLRLPDGSAERLRVRSLVGLLPICAIAIFEADDLENLPHLRERCRALVAQKSALTRTMSPPEKRGVKNRGLLAVCDETKLRRLLTRMLDEQEFFSPFGIRSLSRAHRDNPYVFRWDDQENSVNYLPAESDSGMFGGNSNWRGPIWMPVNIMLARSLVQLYSYYGDDFVVECPTGSGKFLNLYEVAEEIGSRLVAIFTRDGEGRRPVYGGTEKFQTDPHWRDHLLFYEYFHGDNGAGIGASHQTGWTGCVSLLPVMFQTLSPERLLETGAGALAKAVAVAHRESQ